MNAQVPLRVLHVVRQFHPSIGGLEDVVLNLAREQRRLCGVDARVLTLDRVFTNPSQPLSREESVEGIPVFRLPWFGSSRYPLAPTAIRHLGCADIVHVHALDFFFDYLAYTRPIHRRRLVASTHGGFFHTKYRQGLKKLWFSTITRASIRAYGAIIAVSEADAVMFADVAAGRLVTIENGVNLSKFPSRPEIIRDPRRILVFGRLTRHKRIDRIVALLAALQRQEPNWTLVVTGPAGDYPIEEILDRAQAAGVASAVRIRVAPSDADLAEEIAGATWYASASSHEGFGLAAVEAAAAGLVPVLSDIPPYARLHARLQAGLLFDPEDPGAVAPRMIAMAATLSSDGEMTRRSIANSVATYGWAPAVAAHVRLYQALMMPKAASRDAVRQWA